MTLSSEIDARLAILTLALLLDALFGDPRQLWRRIPHPVVLFGAAITAADKYGNRRRHRGRRRRINGIIAIAALTATAAATGYAILRLAAAGGAALRTAVEVMFVAVLLAARGLHDHVRDVAAALTAADLPAARAALAHIVGRDVNELDGPAIARAAIESTAENLADGVIAPALFYLVFGLPGIFAYKMINTADSMLGYQSAKYFAFGYGAARLDDLANYIPSRLTGLLIACAAPTRFKAAAVAARRDAPRHASPNAGWPESAMAAVLGVALAGTRRYRGRMRADATINESGRVATGEDVLRGLSIMRRAVALFAVIVIAAVAA